MLQTFVTSKNYYINVLSPKGLELLFKFQLKLVVWWLYFMNLLTDLFGKNFFTNTSSRLLCYFLNFLPVWKRSNFIFSLLNALIFVNIDLDLGKSKVTRNIKRMQILKHFAVINFLLLNRVFLPFTGRLSAVNYQNLPFTAGKSKWR